MSYKILKFIITKICKKDIGQIYKAKANDQDNRKFFMYLTCFPQTDKDAQQNNMKFRIRKIRKDLIKN